MAGTHPSRPLRILALIEALSVTGPAKNLLGFGECVRAMRPCLAELTIATFRRGATPGADRFLEAAYAARIPVDVIPERAPFDTQHLPRLRAIVRERAPDLIQTHNTKSHFLVRLSGLWRERPWVAFHHGYTTTDFKMRVYNQFDRWSLRTPRQVVAVSEAFVGGLVRMGVPEGRIVVVHSAVNPVFAGRVAAVNREAARASLGIREGERIVLAVGRLSREKAIADLVAAMAELRRPNLRLVIAGDGPERANIERAAAAAGLRPVMPGLVRDVAPFYAIADVLALPSLSEGSPNVLLEAMAAGVPVAATAVGGVPEIAVDGETALLVAPCDTPALSGAIARLLDDAALANRLAANAREVMLARYSPEARTARLLEICTAL